jgi:hypothetical protein
MKIQCGRMSLAAFTSNLMFSHKLRNKYTSFSAAYADVSNMSAAIARIPNLPHVLGVVVSPLL